MRTDTATRVIAAPTRTIYRALLNAVAVAEWRAPDGMRNTIEKFQVREGGEFRMALAFTDEDHRTRGKTTEHEDVVHGKFVKLVLNQQVVEEVEFETEDEAFKGPMTITTTLVPVPGGTRITVVCENVPQGIKAKDHQKGLESSLANLAAFVERR
jgi:uncharacterized protein YndB with AHSA1/START domain